jgi:hypothetical protein
MAGTRTLTLLPGVSVRVAPLLAEHPPCVAKRRQPTETRKEIVSVDQADRNPQSRGRVRERGNRHGICTRVAYFLVQQLPHGGVQSPENISSPCPCSWRRRLLRSGVRTVCGWEVGGGRRWRRRWREEDEWGVEAEGGAEAAEVCAFWGCLVRRKMGGEARSACSGDCRQCPSKLLCSDRHPWLLPGKKCTKFSAFYRD